MRPQRAILLTKQAAQLHIGTQLQAFAECGIVDVTLVAQIERQTIGDAAGDRVRILQNPFSRQTGTLFSLWLARSIVRLGTLIVDLDSPVEAADLRLVTEAHVPDAVLVHGDLEWRRFEVAKVGAEGGRHLVRHAEALLAGGGSDASASLALRSLSQRWPLRPVMNTSSPLVELRVAV